jgi:hypothetical protein
VFAERVNLSDCAAHGSEYDHWGNQMPKLETRLAWFDRGAEAFARACPSVVRDVLPSNVGPLYVCPLCVTPTGFRAFMRQAVETNQLTAEHAPPEFAGGRAIALTCASCNHTAGSKLDSHASIAARYEDDPPGVLRDQRVRVVLGQTQVNMTLEAGPAGMQLFGDEDRNSPTAQAAFFAELNRLVESGDRNWSFNLQFRQQYDFSRAAASWLRAAYIAAFAKFGYRLVLDAAYTVVRQKIETPASAPSLFGIRVPHSPKDARVLVIIREPAVLDGGVAVLMGRHLVLLPGPGDLTFYDRVKGEEGKPVEIRGTFLRWPLGPEFYYDLNQRSTSVESEAGA